MGRIPSDVELENDRRSEGLKMLRKIKEAKDIRDNHKVGETISEIDQKVCDNVVISIDKILEGLPRVNPNCNTIYQVSKELRGMNDKAYTPQFISIGPVHHHTRNDLIANEHYKLQGFNNFLRRINVNNKQSDSLKELVKICHGWVKEAWNCYAEPIKMEKEEFVLMMLVDACFIVEFFILLNGKFLQIQDNVNFSFYRGILFDILRDLIKLENQVPFFLLQNLFDLIPEDDVPSVSDDEDHGSISFIYLTYMALKLVGFVRKYEVNDDLHNKEPKHLVDVLSFFFIPLSLDADDDMQNKHEHEMGNGENNKFLSFFHLLFRTLWQKKKNSDFLSFFGVSSFYCLLKKKKPNHDEWRFIPPSITQLLNAGVIIKVAENDKCFMNISFKNGVLGIPRIVVDDNFEVMMRNLIAFEVFLPGNQNKYAIHYVSFLNDLTSTEVDVHWLMSYGVIINDIGGSYKEISELFNNLTKFVACSVTSHFDDTSKALSVHYKKGWNRAKAMLRHYYFNTPLVVFSFFAGTSIIILTILQTIFSAISAFPN